MARELSEAPGGLQAPGLAEGRATRGPEDRVLLGDADPDVLPIHAYTVCIGVCTLGEPF